MDEPPFAHLLRVSWSLSFYVYKNYSFFPQEILTEPNSTDYSCGWHHSVHLTRNHRILKKQIYIQPHENLEVKPQKILKLLLIVKGTDNFTTVVHAMIIYFLVQNMWFSAENNINWVKRIRIRSFSDPYFPAFGLNTEIYFIYRTFEYGHSSLPLIAILNANQNMVTRIFNSKKFKIMI